MSDIDIKARHAAHRKRWPGKNLGEVLGFLESIFPEGVSGRTLAEDLGVTPQSVSGLFSKDDMWLSKAEEIARIYGHELRIFFPLRKQYEWFTPPPPRQEFPNAGNLSGLVQYINDSGWTVSHAANVIGRTPTSLFRALNKGDIRISYLNDILDALGICAIWKFVPENKGANGNMDNTKTE